MLEVKLENVSTVTKAEMEEYFSRMIDTRLKQAVENFLIGSETRIKEFSLLERVIRVEEELKSLREMSEMKFEAVEKRFEALLREMNARFEAMDKRFESLQREMNARFEAVDKRFSTLQWMIGLFVGIPALFITVMKVIEIIG
jgi:hypothetical protein